MKPLTAVGAHRRRAYVTIVVLLMTGVLLMLAWLTGRLAFESFRRERHAHLLAIAEEALLSARAWSELNAAALHNAPSQLPLDDIVPPGVEATLSLKLIPGSDEGPPLVECRLHLRRAAGSLQRDVRWPAAVSRRTTPPASQPAP